MYNLYTCILYKCKLTLYIIMLFIINYNIRKMKTTYHYYLLNEIITLKIYKIYYNCVLSIRQLEKFNIKF